MSAQNTLSKILLLSVLATNIVSANSMNEVKLESLGLNLGYAYMYTFILIWIVCLYDTNPILPL